MGEIPTLIGEFGLPMDLDGKRAYRDGDYSKHIEALDAYFKGMEANLLHYTLWNYTADNTNARGDHWNDEDLSVFSTDQQTHPEDINSGGRALEAIIRPYPRKIAGELLSYSFDWKEGLFIMEFTPDPSITAPTEIFVPQFHFPEYDVTLSSGTYQKEPKHQRLLIQISEEIKKVSLTIQAKR